jgi:hypothetical protein
VRYLVVIPADGPPLEIRYRDLSSVREFRDGDRVLLDELAVRVRAVLAPTDDEHDAVLVCRPDDEPH